HGGQTPVLALRLVQVRRRANRYAREYLFLTAPGMASAWIGAYGQVGDQAYRHACIASTALNIPHALVGQPLKEQMKMDFSFMGGGIYPQRRTEWVAQIVRPVLPTALGAQLVYMGAMQRLESGVTLKSLTALSYKFRQVFPQCII